MSTIRLGAIFLIVGSIISLIFSLLWIIGPQPEVGANIFEKFGQQSLKSGTSTKIFSLLQSFPLLLLLFGVRAVGEKLVASKTNKNGLSQFGILVFTFGVLFNLISNLLNFSMAEGTNQTVGLFASISWSFGFGGGIFQTIGIALLAFAVARSDIFQKTFASIVAVIHTITAVIILVNFLFLFDPMDFSSFSNTVLPAFIVTQIIIVIWAFLLNQKMKD